MTTYPLMRQALATALIALAGCASPPPARQWLSLPLPKPLPLASPVHAATPPAATRVLVVRRVGIPEYLQTDKVRYRQADALLGQWPHTVWAERLELGLTDHLVMRLRLSLPGWTVCERSCPAQASSTTLNVDFAPLDHVRTEGVLRAQAHWLLNDKGTHTDTVAVHPDSPEGQAMALGQALDHLASDIAATLRTGP
jgi:uncharacterized lipoprotein YmbA